MSVHEDALRDLAANHGWGFCDAVADEINDLEASYASLFKTHGELQRDLASAQSEITSLTANLSARNAEILEAQEELRAVGGHVGGGAFYRDEHGGRLPMRDQVGQHIAEMNQKLAAAQEELERERMRLVACGVVAMANTPESAADARQIHEDYRSASLSDVERAVNAEMKLRTDLAAAQEALKAAEELAERSTRRMVEMSEPGFIGAFAARDAAIDRAQRAEERADKFKWQVRDTCTRAERAEERAERAERDAERYRKARRNGGFFFSSDRMTDAEIDARIDELPDYVDDISSGELSAAIARGKE